MSVGGKSMARIAILISSLAVVFMFQNCQQATMFSASGGSSASKAGEGVLTTTDIVRADLEQNPEEGGSAPTSSPGSGTSSPDVADNGSSPSDDGKALHVCMVKVENGNAKIALADSSIVTQRKRPGVICMSEYACRNIVGQVYEVVKVLSPGYCKNADKQLCEEDGDDDGDKDGDDDKYKDGDDDKYLSKSTDDGDKDKSKDKNKDKNKSQSSDGEGSDSNDDSDDDNKRSSNDKDDDDSDCDEKCEKVNYLSDAEMQKKIDVLK
jgi:hypothetical protein